MLPESGWCRMRNQCSASGGVFVWISHAASPLHECECLSVCPGATKYMHTAHPVHWCASVCLHLQWRAQVLAQLALRLLLAFPSAIKIRIRYEIIGGKPIANEYQSIYTFRYRKRNLSNSSLPRNLPIFIFIQHDCNIYVSFWRNLILLPSVL